MSDKTQIVVTQLRGLSHKPEAQRLILKGLGLRRIGHTVTVRDTPAIRGMIEKVQHLVDVKVMKGEAPLFGSRHRNADGTPKAAAKAPKAKAPKAAKA
jgi:large subunit ribosomal protein L30